VQFQPLWQTSTFIFDDYGKPKEHDYSRTSNLTRKALEDALTELEGGNAGFAFASEMAAITTIIHILTGDHVIVCDDCYGGTYRLFSEIMTRFGLEFIFLRLDDDEKILDAVKTNTKMIWIEAPSNPLLNITDIEMVSKIAKKNSLLTVADNTFSSPYFLKPVDFGIDMICTQPQNT